MLSIWRNLSGIHKFALVLALIGLVFLSLGYLGEIETRNFLKTALPAKGTLAGHDVEVERREREKGPDKYDTYYRGRIVFRDQNEKEYTFTTLHRTVKPEGNTGDVLEVLYDPTDPSNARVNTKDELYYSAQGMNLAAMIFLIAALVIFALDALDAKLRRSKKKEMSDDEARRAHFGEHD